MNSLQSAWILGILMLLAAAPVFGAAQSATPRNGTDPGTVSEARDAATAMDDIHDIKSLEKAKFDPRWLWPAVVLFGVGLLALIAFCRHRRGRRQTRQDPSPPAHVRALQALLRLEGESARSGREFYFRLSFIFRRYLRERFGIEALEMTSEELLPAVRPLASEHDRNEELQAFVAIGDAVKFAVRPVSRVQMRLDLDFVRDWVQRTAPDSPAGEGPE